MQANQVVEPKMDQQQFKDILRNLIQEFSQFASDRLEQEQNNQKAWIESQFKITQSMNIVFECCVSRQKVKVPVSFTQCINNKKHFDDYFDLEQLIVYINIVNNKQAKVICPSCKDQIKIPKLANTIDILKEILRPHIFIYNLRKQVGIYPKDIIYYHKQKLIIPFYKGKYQTYFNQHYHEENFGIEPILLQQPREENQFIAISKKLNDYTGCDFVNVCLISQVRVNIPVRGTKCVHYESYDLIALHKHLFESESKTMNCIMYGCQSVFDLKSPESIQIDFQLLQAGREGLSFSINFTYIPNIQKLSEMLYHRQRDDIILSYKVGKSLEANLEYLNKIYEIAESIFVNNENNKKQTESFLKLQNTKIPNLDDLLVICPITNYGIELPARCRNCIGLKVTDLRYLACILNQVKNEKDVEGVKKVQKECPLCNSPFSATVKPPLKFIDQIYIDVKMMKFFLQNPFYQRTVQAYQQFLKQQQNGDGQGYVHIKKINIQESKCWGVAINMYKLNLKCILTSNQIKVPVRCTKCINHYDCFDKESLEEYQMKVGNLEQICCPKCGQKFESISNFYIDSDLHYIFQKHPDGIQSKNSAYIDITSKKLTLV
ncbi:unnamed protein product (macronuclear) [Paramecium tetraurelia]|uniref:Uncharacterized protein n=1 Tax=Paramecium tetraurelia TaxID=5888 RepID=A0CXA7_PARTE|nr:uncharacterized protein GSPATT00011056001 [Paramecium tetraurelia]CAK75424.1 unnamed protein product [Paramecium tetraurelia]|eukprot:XP_001442821.1 hypothetical protein (macronuclear) [Paramecium tetraurelia strain d4-2]